MIDLPRVTTDRIKVFADWAELSALVRYSSRISAADIADVVKGAGRIGDYKGDTPPGFEPTEDWEAFSEEEHADRFAEAILRELSFRERNLADAYPFKVEDDVLHARLDAFGKWTAYIGLLIVDLSRQYAAEEGSVVDWDSDSFRRLFEKVVEAAECELFSGNTARFGWPIEPGWPKPVNERIERLGAELLLKIELLEGKTDSKDKDRGLDIAARVAFGDDEHGTVAVLTQCATGKHWRKKTGEPSLAEWHNILQWESLLVRAIAIPWRLERPYGHKQCHREFEAVVLDRPRICWGFPDKHLDDATRAELRTWCDEQLKKFPKLK